MWKICTGGLGITRWKSLSETSIISCCTKLQKTARGAQCITGEHESFERTTVVSLQGGGGGVSVTIFLIKNYRRGCKKCSAQGGGSPLSYPPLQNTFIKAVRSGHHTELHNNWYVNGKHFLATFLPETKGVNSQFSPPTVTNVLVLSVFFFFSFLFSGEGLAETWNPRRNSRHCSSASHARDVK